MDEAKQSRSYVVKACHVETSMQLRVSFEEPTAAMTEFGRAARDSQYSDVSLTVVEGDRRTK